jgi:hypothetical protein
MKYLNDEFRSRSTAIFAFCLTALILGLSFYFNGYNNTWDFFKVPYMSPHFADLRTITGGAESYALGIDLMVNNPGDPW